MGAVGGWLRAAGELVLPRECGGCTRPGMWWCDSCARSIDGSPRAFDVSTNGSTTRCHAAAPYRGAAGAALVAMKERGAGALVGPLSGALARAVRAAVNEAVSAGAPGASGSSGSSHTPIVDVVLVPAPSRPAVVRARGADVVADLAHACAARLCAEPAGVRVRVVRCLVHARPVADQASLDADARLANLAGALRMRRLAAPLIAGRVVIVVDDVLTTGATLADSVRAIRSAAAPAPARWVGGATVAAAGAFGAAFADAPGVHVAGRPSVDVRPDVDESGQRVVARLVGD